MAPSKKKEANEKERKEKLKIKLKKTKTNQSLWFEGFSYEADADEESRTEPV